MHHSSPLAAIAMLASFALADPVSEGTDIPPPWADGTSIELVANDVGGVRVHIPPVSDAYIDRAPINEITAWVSSQWSAHALELQMHRYISANTSPPQCMVISVRPMREPLTDEQWDRFALRVAAAIQSDNQPTRESGYQAAGFLSTVPASDSGPQHGSRAIGEALWQRSHARECLNKPGFASLLGAFAIDSAFHRREINRINRSDDADERAFLGDVLCNAAWADHDLPPAEAIAIAAALLELAEEHANDRRRTLTMASAAFSTAGESTGSVAFIERAMASSTAPVRTAALRHATGVIRHAREHNDRATSRSIEALKDEFVAAAMSDPDERASSTAAGTLWALLETSPHEAVAMMIAILDAPHDMTVAMACMYMSEHPDLVRPFVQQLRKTAASGGPNASQAARELLDAIERP